MKEIYLYHSTRSDKKYMVKVDGKTIHFGAKGYENYGGVGKERHTDEERKKRYITRHKERENWTKSGIATAGFWSRWLLWNKPTLQQNIKDIQQRFNVKII